MSSNDTQMDPTSVAPAEDTQLDRDLSALARRSGKLSLRHLVMEFGPRLRAAIDADPRNWPEVIESIERHLARPVRRRSVETYLADFYPKRIGAAALARKGVAELNVPVNFESGRTRGDHPKEIHLSKPSARGPALTTLPTPSTALEVPTRSTPTAVGSTASAPPKRGVPYRPGSG